MTAARRLVALLVTGLATLLPACGPVRLHNSEPSAQTVVVLLPDPDSGIVGRVVVSNKLGTADLAAARASTRVLAERAPSPVVELSEADTRDAFASVLATLPARPRSFTLFFRFESDELTAESRAILPEVLRAVMEREAPEVEVIGHTDTRGTREANADLGRKRAIMVQGVLVDAGLDRSLIEVSSHGEGDLFVQTPDETFEPRNRRVEITVR